MLLVVALRILSVIDLNGPAVISHLLWEKYEPILVYNTYKVTMRLTIRGVSASDYGTYVCLSKNSLGETDGQIKLYPLIPSTVAAKATTLPSSISAVSPEKGSGRRLNNGAGNRTKSSSTRTSHRRESQHSETAIRPQSPNSVLRNPDDDSSTGNCLPALLIVSVCVMFLLLNPNTL